MEQAGRSAESGFVVNPLGYIEFPIIGKVKVLGLTESQLKETLNPAVGKYVKDPLVDVQFTTFRITVLGEVKSPGNFTMDMQRTTYLPGSCGGGRFAQYGKTDDVQIIP